MFSPLRFSNYAKDLSKAINLMQGDDLKSALADVPGVENITMRVDGRSQYLSLNGRSVEIDTNASADQIRKALNLGKIDQASKAKPMSITGLQSGAFQAKLAEMRQKVADKQTQALAKIDTIVNDGTAKLEAAANDAATKAQKEIDDALHEFAPFTNGAPD